MYFHIMLPLEQPTAVSSQFPYNFLFIHLSAQSLLALIEAMMCFVYTCLCNTKLLTVLMLRLFIRTGAYSRRKQTDPQRRTGRNCQLQWWRAASQMIFHQNPPLGLVAGEHARLIPFLISNTLLRCLSQTRLSWTSCVKESISQTWMR